MIPYTTGCWYTGAQSRALGHWSEVWHVGGSSFTQRITGTQCGTVQLQSGWCVIDQVHTQFSSRSCCCMIHTDFLCLLVLHMLLSSVRLLYTL